MHNSTARETDMSFVVKRLESVADTQIIALSHLLIDCVEGWCLGELPEPTSFEKASAFWRRCGRDNSARRACALVAEDAVGTIGTVQLILDLPENQPHRADLSKMLVHRRARRKGVAAALLRAAEELARDARQVAARARHSERGGGAPLCTAWLGTGRYDSGLCAAAGRRLMRYDFFLSPPRLRQ